MFYDLNVPWTGDGIRRDDVLKTLSMLEQLGYDMAAVTQVHDGKLPNEPVPTQIPREWAFERLRVGRRLTIVMDSSLQNTVLNTAARNFDVLALQPTTEKLLAQACNEADCDIISLDFTSRLPFTLKHSIVGAALARGIQFEVCYAPMIRDASVRKHCLSNAQALVTATRGKGIILSSGAERRLECRAPYDVMNLATLWGQSQDRARVALTDACRDATFRAHARAQTHKSVLRITQSSEPVDVEPTRKRQASVPQPKPKKLKSK